MYVGTSRMMTEAGRGEAMNVGSRMVIDVLSTAPSNYGLVKQNVVYIMVGNRICQ